MTAGAELTTDEDLAEAEELPPEQGWYVYGIIGAREDGRVELPEGLTGLDDAPVEAVVHGRTAAVVGAIRLERPPGRRADLVAHKEVVDSLAAAGPVVPVRFGSVLTDRAAVADELLAPDVDHLTALLEDLTGRHQFTVRARYREQVVLAEVVDSDPEIAELRERTRDVPEDVAYGERVRLGELVARAMEAKREADGRAIADAVLPLVAAHVDRPGASVDHLLELAVLVDDERRADLEETLEGVAEAMHERVRLQLVGPMAPYDFVEA